MRRSTRRKIIIVGVLLITYSAITYGLPYLLLDAPFARVNATETLKERFSREYTQSLDVKYSKGSPQLSRESPSGTVLGLRHRHEDTPEAAPSSTFYRLLWWLLVVAAV